MEPLKAITLHQPWATLMSVGAKMWETRSWATDYRGKIAIHASKTFSKGHKQLADLEFFARYLDYRDDDVYLKNDVFPLPRGRIIAVGYLDNVLATDQVE